MSEVRAFWYTAEEMHQTVKRKLAISQGEGFRWLKEGLDMLPYAIEHGDLERCMEEPVTTVDTRWDTFIAAGIQWKLRTLGIEAPAWTFKEPLEEEWCPYSVVPSLIAKVRERTPPELKRVGILQAEAALR